MTMVETRATWTRSWRRTRALAVASPASGMASPAVREARRAFEEALVKALEACDAQDALSARVAACE